jgi:hypothetical protein
MSRSVLLVALAASVCAAGFPVADDAPDEAIFDAANKGLLDLATVKAALIEAGYTVEEGTGAELAAKLINDAADGESIKAQLEEAQATIAKLEGQLAAAKSHKPEPPARVKAASSKVRKLGSKGKCEAPKEGLRSEPIELLSNGGLFEIVASDGKQEIVAFNPVEAESRAFVPWGSHQVMLNVPVELKGSDSIEHVDGFALLHDGKQIDYCRLLEPLRVGPGEHHRVASSIFFG